MLLTEPLFLMGFSAGVVGAVTAAKQWQKPRGNIQGLMAIDGWGVPLWADFPCYRLSPDCYNHWLHQGLGQCQSSFYADPPCSHLDLLRSPQTRYGWCSYPEQRPMQYATLADFIRNILNCFFLSNS
jgi:pimeloyl-ACP methyl ester carboxylesterase